ncbi:DsbE family thiol:disulfide interchange protein [Testudinibacter aquarius]|uniref:Cytochrome c biogenesis protein CcmG/thiol:disulfide interchange protein DsbE n=1 Tax=Testudinibacter aquarius TaxID=1524974 RepID=A0A4V2W1R5_9PAST|nr:DsbE family thiol:disulfide interchange protein [Testudinibacter aquarius]KAE9525409.1 thiol:disulfide interchange protein [Testudinibacter aquarius]TCV85229.1 cytochrome c biogenesis protein CcmG/thiol:disulfide interchange protein DsbE [Testudinibacter aquarius]TNG92154.1 DsbE family thiol:disulfide interchange protein [Testudinibacter aquarius]
MKKRLALFLPLLALLALGLVLLLGLQRDPSQLALAQQGKPLPEFQLTDLLQPTQRIDNRTLPKQPFLLNVWGSWCPSCIVEHPFLMQLKQQGYLIYGLNYRDNPQSARQMLVTKGNPFVQVLNDHDGKLALALGVYGAPETYLIDGDGIIRFRYVGELEQAVWQQQFMPLLKDFSTSVATPSVSTIKEQ